MKECPYISSSSYSRAYSHGVALESPYTPVPTPGSHVGSISLASRAVFTGFLHLGCNLGAGKMVAVSCVALTVSARKRVLFVMVSRRPFLAPVPKYFLQGLLGYA